MLPTTLGIESLGVCHNLGVSNDADPTQVAATRSIVVWPAIDGGRRLVVLSMAGPIEDGCTAFYRLVSYNCFIHG